jgi:hypothetical protein
MFFLRGFSFFSFFLIFVLYKISNIGNCHLLIWKLNKNFNFNIRLCPSLIILIDIALHDNLINIYYNKK